MHALRRRQIGRLSRVTVWNQLGCRGLMDCQFVDPTTQTRAAKCTKDSHVAAKLHNAPFHHRQYGAKLSQNHLTVPARHSLHAGNVVPVPQITAWRSPRPNPGTKILAATRSRPGIRRISARMMVPIANIDRIITANGYDEMFKKARLMSRSQSSRGSQCRDVRLVGSLYK